MLAVNRIVHRTLGQMCTCFSSVYCPTRPDGGLACTTKHMKLGLRLRLRMGAVARDWAGYEAGTEAEVGAVTKDGGWGCGQGLGWV